MLFSHGPRLPCLILILLALASSCAGGPPGGRNLVLSPSQGKAFQRGRGGPVSATVLQGFLGANLTSELERNASNGDQVDGASESISLMPLAGGGILHTLQEGNLAFGFEAFLSGSGRSNEDLLRTRTGTADVDVSVDLLLFDLYGGPFVRTQLSEEWRAVASLGPLLQFAQWDEKTAGVEFGRKGVGLGFYARFGVERLMGSGDLMGLALRWSSAELDLGDQLGDLDVGGVQVVFTLSRGL